MITHEEAKECISRLFDSYIYGDFIPFPTRSDLDTLSLYINQQEAIQAEHEALKCDVARYLELVTYEYGEDWQTGKISLVEYRCLALEEEELKQKLSKVGKE